MLSFDILGKGLKIVSPSYFECDFFKKREGFSCYVLLTGQIFLPLLPEILGNMCVATVYEPECDVKNFEIKLIFLINLFLLHNQKFKKKI